MTIRIALVYPELLGTYGDGGNALVAAERLRRRGLAAEVVAVTAGEAVPSQCDLYLLGGGEDEPQVLAAAGVATGGLAAAVQAGAVCLAVCAGFQILGRTFPGTDGRQHDGAGLIPADTVRGSQRAVGDLAVDAPGIGLLTGYENHGGRTLLDAGTVALGTVAGDTAERGRAAGDATPSGGRLTVGVGNGTPDRSDGCRVPLGRGLVVGTYLHGPALAQNPALADFLLGHLTGPLEPLELASTAALASSRRAQLGLGHPGARTR